MNLTVLQVLSHRDFNKRLYELGTQEREDIQELQKKSERLKNEVRAAKERTAKIETIVADDEVRQDPKRGTAERESSTGSRVGSKSSDSPEVRSSTRRKENDSKMALNRVAN